MWEWPGYPQYCIPPEDLVEGTLIDDGRTGKLGAGPARRHSLRVRDTVREGAAWIWQDGAPEAVVGTVRFRWDALDRWLEEDEPVFVHPEAPTPGWTRCVRPVRCAWSWTAWSSRTPRTA